VIVGARHPVARAVRLLRDRRAVVITSRRVWRHVGGPLRTLADPASMIQLPDRERAKTWAEVARIHDAALARGVRRGDVVIAVGGGSVGDTAGFAAATYMRGMEWIVVPTTLLAMVDSAIGGKVGVNHGRSKNLVGAFHQPHAVVVDLAFLRTLPRRELRGGSYEILKCALIGDRALFEALARRGAADAWPPALMRRAVLRSIRLKARVVSADEREGGLRRVLNFGHTFGHAIEAATGFARISHGEAVGHGIVAAAHVARGRGLLAAPAFERIVAAVAALGPRPSVAMVDYAAIRRAIGTDKKAVSSRPTFILPRGIGRVVVSGDVSEREMRAAWDYLRGGSHP
jgi:3-dehydroquinate synthase